MTTEKAIFAAGCFWGVEELLRNVPGIITTEVGYCGDSKSTANYSTVKDGETNHAEAILIEFDPAVITYETCVEKFFQLHDPTTKNQQGNDIGRQYRSAIFYLSETQKLTALKVIEKLTAAHKFKKPIVTELTAAGEFYRAEDYHQDYLQKNPGGYTCHYWRKD
jgi:methionine-S-sulfoxide reductase